VTNPVLISKIGKGMKFICMRGPQIQSLSVSVQTPIGGLVRSHPNGDHHDPTQRRNSIMITKIPDEIPRLQLPVDTILGFMTLDPEIPLTPYTCAFRINPCALMITSCSALALYPRNCSLPPLRCKTRQLFDAMSHDKILSVLQKPHRG
jgi:hypothetical protein